MGNGLALHAGRTRRVLRRPLLLPGRRRHPRADRRHRHQGLPAVSLDRRVRLFGLAARHRGRGGEDSRCQGDHHEGPRPFSDERAPGGVPRVPASSAGRDSPPLARLRARGGVPMRFAALALCVLAFAVHAQQKEIKIGFIYDVTGPFAGGGSEPAQIGTKAAIDMFNEKGGVMGYKINATFADAQSKVDVAINEMTRLIDQEKVDIVAGVYSSAQCVPMVQQVDARKKFLWLNVCIATAVFKDKKLAYVFRPQAHSDQFGAYSCDYMNYYSKDRFGIVPKNLKVAIIYEDGPYGVAVATGNAAQSTKHGMNVVMKGGYCATAPY